MPLKSRGFTLIEIMIVVAIVAVLASIAYASYSSQTQKARRADAKDALLAAAATQERLRLQRNVYSADMTDLGGVQSTEQYYTLSAVNTARGDGAACDAGNCFTITAVPTAGSPQAGDTACASFSVDNLGRKFALDSGGNDAAANCW